MELIYFLEELFGTVIFSLVRSNGKSTEVKWKYEEDDVDMLEAGIEMSMIAKLPFEFVKK